MSEKIVLKFDDQEIEKKFVGPLNRYLEIISSELNVNIDYVGNTIITKEEDKFDLINAVCDLLNTLCMEKIEYQERDIIYIIESFKQSNDYILTKSGILNFYTSKKIIVYAKDGSKIYPKTINQMIYCEALTKNSIIFAKGSAGTGKTFLAVSFAVGSLKKNQIRKIIITRPVVEAGEKLGFLPGDLKEKVDPYLIPIYDVLYELLGKEQTDKYLEKGIIEIAPLAYMRGRTLDNAVIILDEAQNTTTSQMKMFVTRLGFNSKMIITGDESQIDLSSKEKSGLIEATAILKGIPGIGIVNFSRFDVMRHPLVTKIIARYEEVNNDKVSH